MLVSGLLSVCPSLGGLGALVYQGVDRLGQFMAQSMAYGPKGSSINYVTFPGGYQRFVNCFHDIIYG
jgi:hypothetical protein